MKKILFSAFFCLLVNLAFSQPTSDMSIARYNDDGTPYPLYAGKFGPTPEWTNAELEIIGKNFNGFYGNFDGLTPEKTEKIRRFRKDFQFLKYNGGWKLGDEPGEYNINNIEQQYPNEILYYRVANLAKDIDAVCTNISLTDLFGSLLPSTASPDHVTSYKTESGWKYITWLKIDDEFMRIDAVNGNSITVTRGFKSTVANPHKAGIAVICPVYGSKLTTNKLEYRADEGGIIRWKRLTRNLINEWQTIKGGIWIDILIGNLSQNSMDGLTLLKDRIWDIRKNQVYSPNNRSRNTELGIKMMQDDFYAKFGIYPIIWGNNMMFPTTLTDDRIKMLEKTTIKPRPIDGFAQENCFGGYGIGGDSGSEHTFVNLEDWKHHVQSIMFMGEQKLNARPLSMDGGKDNGKFAQEPDEFRHRVLLFCYTSYLMGVKVEPDGKIYTQFGITPIVAPKNGTPYVKIEPFFKFQIGKPIETLSSKDFIQYKMVNRNVFVRKFENGIVLVNPSENDENNINLLSLEPSKKLYNPDINNNTLKTISMPAKTGIILMYK